METKAGSSLGEMTDLLARLSGLGWEYGPFFFAIFFTLIVTSRAHRYYQQVLQRTPPPSLEEELVYRRNLRLSIYSSIVLTSLAVIWWLYIQVWVHKYVFQGEIASLGVQDQLAPTRDYFHFRQTQRLVGKTYRVDWHFVLVRNKPFRDGEKFTLQYFPGDPQMDLIGQANAGYVGSPIELNLVYRAQDVDVHRYELMKDPKKGTILVDLGDMPNGLRFVAPLIGEYSLAAK